MSKRHQFETEYRQGNKKDHTHVRFNITGFMLVVSKQMFIEHFPDRSKSSSRMYLIKTKYEL